MLLASAAAGALSSACSRFATVQYRGLRGVHRESGARSRRLSKHFYDLSDLLAAIRDGREGDVAVVRG